MAEATLYQEDDCTLDLTAAAAYSAGEVIQLADGRAGVVPLDFASGALLAAQTEGIWTVAKTASICFLDGGKVYWDHSANKAHFKKVSDRDFYLGRAVGDAASASPTLKVNLNIDPPYDIDIQRDAFTTVLVGTAAAGAFGYPRILGGAHGFYLTATSEAQKVDAFAVDGFSTSANAIVEFAFRCPNGGSGSASDFSVGIANATHATDADSIADSVFMHLDGGSTNINFESDDGTTEVAATDSTKDFTAGTANTNRVEVWMDLRNPADIQMYVDGVNVLPSSVFDVSAYAGPWYPCVHLEKTTGTETADIIIDWHRTRFAQQ